MMPSATDLTYFIEVAQTQNLSRASERLGLSQPSLSLSIQRLERDIGAKLFNRSKRGVHLTQAGKSLFIQARNLLQQWEKIKDGAIEAETQVKGTYLLGVHPSVALYTLPQILPQVMKEYPQLELKMLHDLSRKVTERVIAMEVDLGIVVNPVRHPDLVIHKLCEDEVGFWSSAEKGNELIQLSSAGKVLICDPELLQTQSLMKSQKIEFKNFQRVITSSNLEVIRSMVVAGSGIGILPGRVAALSPELKRMAGSPIFRDTICLIHRLENRSSPFVKVMKERLEKSMSR